MSAAHLRTVLELLPNAFHRVAAAGDIIHARLGLSSGMRGILLSLAQTGPLSVSKLAAMRPVSRQFVQKLVDEMVTSGWVEALPNPSHKRSPLIALTSKGRAAVGQVQSAELPQLALLADGFSAEELDIATGVLRAICDRLNPQVLDQLAAKYSLATSGDQVDA
jgi:DNA-binding MarR family transcriptional regulator